MVIGCAIDGSSAKKMIGEIDWGLRACGRSGETAIDLNEATNIDGLYELEISRPQWYLRFRLKEPNIIRRLAQLIRGESGDELRLGAFEEQPVDVLRDNEFSDRYFFVLLRKTGAVRLTLSGSDSIQDVLSALDAVITDMEQ